MPSFHPCARAPPPLGSALCARSSSPSAAPRTTWQVLRASPQSTGRGLSTHCRPSRQAWRARTTSALRGHCWRCQLLVPLTSVAQAHPRPGAARRGRRAAGARGRALEPRQRGAAGGRRRAGRGSAGGRAGGAAAGVGFLVWWSLLTSSAGPAGARRRRVQWRRGPKAGAPSPSRLAPGVGRASRRRGRGGERRRRRRSSAARPEVVWCVLGSRRRGGSTVGRRCRPPRRGGVAPAYPHCRSAPAAAARAASRGESRRHRA